MNKFLLISISFLILIIDIGCAAAADLDGGIVDSDVVVVAPLASGMLLLLMMLFLVILNQINLMRIEGVNRVILLV